jgi:hypothetical protein
MDVPPFIHDAFDPTGSWAAQLRLLEVLPDLSTTHLIQYRLFRASIFPYAIKTTHYLCLSYMWGTPSEHPILVNGGLCYVRTNLWHFLDVARSKCNGVQFWIEAICINQRTMLEKNRLVTVMGQIYSGVEHVIVWLGRSRQLGAFRRFLNVLHAYGIEQATAGIQTRLQTVLHQSVLGTRVDDTRHYSRDQPQDPCV